MSGNGGPGSGVVITFRLNPKLPHEQQALEYLRAKTGGRRGGVRKVVGDALLLAAENDRRLDQIVEMQQRVLLMLEQLESGSITIRGGSAEEEEQAGGQALSEEFKAGLRKIARPVLTLGDVE